MNLASVSLKSTRFIPSKLSYITDSSPLHAQMYRLPGRQPLPDVAVTGTALRTRTHAHGIPGLVMLQSSYPSVEPVLPETRERLDMQEVFGLRRATRRTSPYPLRLRWGVQDSSIHHHAVDANGGITRANDLVQTSSIIAVGT